MILNHITLILAGIAGVLFHCLVKLNSLRNDAIVGNIPFDWKKDYLRKDIVAIMISFCSVGIWFLIYREAAAKYTALDGWKVTSFVCAGGLGSYILQLAFGQAKKRIRKIVNEKTDIADGKISTPKT